MSKVDKSDFALLDEIIEDYSKCELMYESDQLKLFVINEVVKLRKENNLTQNEMSKIVGIPQSNISRFESGKIDPSLSFIQKIVNKLGYQIHVTFEKP